MNKLQSKLINIALTGIGIFFAVLIAMMVYALMYDYEVLEVKDCNYELTKDTFQQGETLTFNVRVCKNKDVDETVLGTFTDGLIFTIPKKESKFEVKCYDDILGSVNVPHSLPEGTYYYTEKIIYTVNPIDELIGFHLSFFDREIEYTFNTDEFRVVESN